MGIPLGFESFELPNKDFLAVEDLGNNKELALISVPEEFDVAELKGISFIVDGTIPLKCSSDSACTQKWEIHGFPAPPKQQTNVLFLSKRGEHIFGPPISVYLNITQGFNIPYQKPLKKTKKKHLEIPENLRVRWKPFGSDEPYRNEISTKSTSKDFIRSNVLKQNASNIEINRSDDVVKKLEASLVVSEATRTPNKKRHNVENYFDKKNLPEAIDELEIDNAKHSKKKKRNTENTLSSNERDEISNASRKNITNNKNKFETNCTLNSDKNDKKKRKQSENEIKSVNKSEIRKSKITIYDCEEENGREDENDYVSVKKKKKKKTSRKDNELNESEKDEKVNLSEEKRKEKAKKTLNSDKKKKENKKVMALSHLNEVNVKETKIFSTDNGANEVEKTKRQGFDEDGEVNKKVKKMKKKSKKDSEAKDDSKEKDLRSLNELNEAKEKKKKKKTTISDDNDVDNNNMVSSADNKIGKIEKNHFSEHNKVDERKKTKKSVNDNEVQKHEDLSEFSQVDRKMKKEKKKKTTNPNDNKISEDKEKCDLIEYNDVQERKKKKKKKKTCGSDNEMSKQEEKSAYGKYNEKGEKKKKKKSLSVSDNEISNDEEKCASSENYKVDERKKRKRLNLNDNENEKVKKSLSDDDATESKKKKKKKD